MHAGGNAPRWRVGRSPAIERILNGAAVSIATIAAALRAVHDDVAPGDVRDAAFLLSTAEGLLFEALVSTLKPVRMHALYIMSRYLSHACCLRRLWLLSSRYAWDHSTSQRFFRQTTFM